MPELSGEDTLVAYSCEVPQAFSQLRRRLALIISPSVPNISTGAQSSHFRKER